MSRLLAILCLLASCSQAQEKPKRRFDQVIIIVLENVNYRDASENPYFKSLIKKGALLKNFYGVTHPSYPNYLAIVGGSTFGYWTDRQGTINSSSIADLLEAKNLSWKNYAEGYPGNCYLGNSKDSYVRKHVPFLSFKSIQDNPSRCAKVVSASEFETDWNSGQIPNYAFYTPDLNNDGHDTGLAFAAQWLDGFLKPLLDNSERMQRTLIAVTFDESASWSSLFGSNQILTLLLGPMVHAGASTSTKYDHYSMLRTIEENFGLGTLRQEDQNASPIENIWVY